MEHTDVTKDAEKTLGNNEETIRFEIVAETTEPRTFYYSVVEKVNGDVKRTKMYSARDDAPQTVYVVRCIHCKKTIPEDHTGFSYLSGAQGWLEGRILNDDHSECGPKGKP